MPSASWNNSAIGKEVYRLLFCARQPAAGFLASATERQGLSQALGRLMLWRTPLALAELAFGWMAMGRVYKTLADPRSELWRRVVEQLPGGVSLQDVAEMLRALPLWPTWASVLPWLLVAAPLYILSLWLHDAVWDHTALWMLRGLKGRKCFRLSLEADAEALTVGSLGALIGLLVYLPGLGWLFALPASVAGAYFWLLRGYALAAFHGCPNWKGIAATLVHVALMLVLGLGFFLLVALLFFLQVG